jgi:hypothetical protein
LIRCLRSVASSMRCLYQRGAGADPAAGSIGSSYSDGMGVHVVHPFRCNWFDSSSSTRGKSTLRGVLSPR